MRRQSEVNPEYTAKIRPRYKFNSSLIRKENNNNGTSNPDSKNSNDNISSNSSSTKSFSAIGCTSPAAPYVTARHRAPAKQTIKQKPEAVVKASQAERCHACTSKDILSSMGNDENSQNIKPTPSVPAYFGDETRDASCTAKVSHMLPRSHMNVFTPTPEYTRKLNRPQLTSKDNEANSTSNATDNIMNNTTTNSSNYTVKPGASEPVKQTAEAHAKTQLCQEIEEDQEED